MLMALNRCSCWCVGLAPKPIEKPKDRLLKSRVGGIWIGWWINRQKNAGSFDQGKQLPGQVCPMAGNAGFQPLRKTGKDAGLMLFHLAGGVAGLRP